MQVRMLRASLKQLEGSLIDAAVIEKACALVAGNGKLLIYAAVRVVRY
jgi:hypothetical protein